jgi:hypothetical protein
MPSARKSAAQNRSRGSLLKSAAADAGQGGKQRCPSVFQKKPLAKGAGWLQTPGLVCGEG